MKNKNNMDNNNNIYSNNKTNKDVNDNNIKTIIIKIVIK